MQLHPCQGVSSAIGRRTIWWVRESGCGDAVDPKHRPKRIKTAQQTVLINLMIFILLLPTILSINDKITEKLRDRLIISNKINLKIRTGFRTINLRSEFLCWRIDGSPTHRIPDQNHSLPLLLSGNWNPRLEDHLWNRYQIESYQKITNLC